ncbi:hypothetical protein [Cytobacillus firmus]|uniref:hypothetical protein n=1 Tax=Cytobacillus firmus TaxID=1399 RepID=UPI0018CD781C|nr:hypothetical protein [Cytobacillus firmus]MBG9586351.1 hypothetical protein [Cytobacillus firmus]
MKKLIPLAVLGVLLILLHSTPNMALRTHVFFSGYPAAAIGSGIIEDAFHNEVDRDRFAELNAKAYTLTEPPVEKATQGKLRNYLVRKYGFFYFAEYYGEG